MQTFPCNRVIVQVLGFDTLDNIYLDISSVHFFNCPAVAPRPVTTRNTTHRELTAPWLISSAMFPTARMSASRHDSSTTPTSRAWPVQSFTARSVPSASGRTSGPRRRIRSPSTTSRDCVTRCLSAHSAALRWPRPSAYTREFPKLTCVGTGPRPHRVCRQWGFRAQALVFYGRDNGVFGCRHWCF
eukprot:COSAG02_NODE_2989_length_7609_cov_11.207723_5_plen_186_part_00